MGLYSIGIDVSEFNCLIAKAKVEDYNFDELEKNLNNAFEKTKKFRQENLDDSYDSELRGRLSIFNKKYFPAIDFKFKIKEGRISEDTYAKEKLALFFKENEHFLKTDEHKSKQHLLSDKEIPKFLTKWFTNRIKQELFYYLKLINEIEDKKIKTAMQIVISRTARSCRATTHSDLATLKEPQHLPYYCHKHRKICTPINSIQKHLKRNTTDAIKRLKEFSKLKKEVYAEVIHADSRAVDILEEIKKSNQAFYKLLKKEKIDGVFTSPPYVGQIDYHEQHAYAYELFDIPRKDTQEIGPLYKGQGTKAQEEYTEGISKVFLNISKFMKEDADFFIVANDKYNLYPKIAERSNLKIVEQFKRPVLNRTERDRQPYSEIIFHMKICSK